MCLVLFAYYSHPRYKLIVAANRDEFYSRPTAALGFWVDAPAVLAGRDLQAGGTWLGVAGGGRFAAITNYRNPRAVKDAAPSRGALVSDFLTGDEPAVDYLARLQSGAAAYNGFNLLLLDNTGLYYYSNRNGAPQRLASGFYGLSNHLLNSAWPKVERGRLALARLTSGEHPVTTAAVLDLLADRTRAPDAALPDTGVGLALERQLSPMFIETPDYGTRASTVVLWETGGAVTVVEKTWPTGEIREVRLTGIT